MNVCVREILHFKSEVPEPVSPHHFADQKPCRLTTVKNIEEET
jgi:hypothetical protein